MLAASESSGGSIIGGIILFLIFCALCAGVEALCEGNKPKSGKFWGGWSED